MARQEQWSKLFQVTLDAYFRFLSIFRPTILAGDEGFLAHWDVTTGSPAGQT
jgi:hypothetical protein